MFYFSLFGAQLQWLLQPRLLAITMRLHIHAQGLQWWAKGEVAALAPDLPSLIDVTTRPTYLPTYQPTFLPTYLFAYLPTYIFTYLLTIVYLPTHFPTYHLNNTNIRQRV
jgi:hypothetical protein